ncbi:MAG: hypothetical protein JOS17DRAFT_780328 [Linnemannia elongata]|nr:MAG: hypothetical protein JOS17DRAFT_780328 [Linnemannia elongata]
MNLLNSSTRTPGRRQTPSSGDTQITQEIRAHIGPSRGTGVTHNLNHQHQHQHQYQLQHTHFHTTRPAQDDDLSQLTDHFHRAANIIAPVPRAPFRRCNGFTTKNTPCQRHGDISVVFNSTNSRNNNIRDTETRHYCHQHEPRMSVDRQCLAIIHRKNRQCLVTCSPSEIRSGGRPICNTHYGTNAKLVPH